MTAAQGFYARFEPSKKRLGRVPPKGTSSELCGNPRGNPHPCKQGLRLWENLPSPSARPHFAGSAPFPCTIYFSIQTREFSHR
jgi:hypothetical protein